MASAVALLGASGIASAQEAAQAVGAATLTVAPKWLADTRFSNGQGIVSGRMVYHPGIAIEGGYDSNLYLRSGGPYERVVDVFKIRVTPHIQFSTRQLTGDGGAVLPMPYTLSGQVALSYQEFLKGTKTTDIDVSGSRNLGILAAVVLNIAPQGKFGGSINAGVVRSIQPSQFGDPSASINRTAPTGGGGVTWRPGGGLFAWAANYQATFTYFEASRYKELNNLRHEIATQGSWQFRPRTSVNFDSTYGLIRYVNSPTVQPNGDFVRARIGLNGLLTTKFGFTGMVGYGTTFYERKGNFPEQDFDSFLGQLEGRFYLKVPPKDSGTPGLYPSTVAIGISRDFTQSYIGNFFSRDRVYANASYFFDGRVLSTVGGGFARASFPATSFADGRARGAEFDAYLVDVNALVEYRIAPNFGVNLSGIYTALLTDMRLPLVPNANPSDPAQFDELKWKRLEILLGARYLL